MAPRLPSECLARERLVDAVVAGLEGRLVVVSAAAGWGKSTLLAQAAARAELPTAWVSCDARLAHGPLLLAHLVAAIGQFYPGFGAGLVLDGEMEDAVQALGNEIAATVPDDLVLVLDDVEELHGAALELLVRELPSTVHLAVSSRAELPFPLAGVRSSGVLELGEGELGLDEAEAQALLRAVGVDLGAEAVAELHRRTEGWPTGLLIAGQAGGPLPSGGRDEARLFEYLAHEVLAQQPHDLQRFLVDLAVLERFTPDLAAAVTGRSDARLRVEELVGRHLFVVRLDDSQRWYRFHALFHAFLRRRLAERPPREMARLHRAAAAAWRATGEPLEAVRHLLHAGDVTAVVRALEPVAELMIETVEADTLGSWLDALPAEAWSDAPGLVLAQASALFARSQYARAFDALVHALDELLASGQRERAAMALFRLLRAMAAVGGQHERGVAVARRYLTRVDAAAPMIGPARVVLAGMYAQACRYPEAEAELRAVGPSDWASVTEAFYVLHPQGASDRALVALEEAIGRLGETPARDPLNVLLFARGYRAAILNDLGRHDEALAESALMSAVAAESGLGRLAVPVIAWLRFDALAGLGRWDELGRELDETRRLFARLGGALRAYLFHLAVARLAGHRQDVGGVAGAVAEAREGLRDHGYPFDEAMVLAGLAEAALAVGLTDLARELVRDGGLAADLAGAPLPRYRATRVGAEAWGPGGPGERLRAEARELAGRWGVVRGARTRTDGRPALRIATFGQLAVWSDGQLVPAAAFERQKARALLAALLCAEGPVHRDTLVGWLWPDLTPKRGLTALQSTLYVLRRALGASAAAPIVSNGATYQAVLDEGDEWDAARFLELVREGDLVGAEHVASGPFLPEWPEAPWAEPKRTEVQEAQRGVLEALAERLAAEGQPAAAISRYRRLLALEPEREGWHRGLMRVYAQAGERALALRQYHACRALLRERLGIEPCRETRVLYMSLLRDS